MTVCLFGNYIYDYPRIVVLREGLKQNDFRVIECHTRKKGLAKYWELFQQHRQIKNQYDVLFVGMGLYSLVWWAKLLSRRTVVFDAFVSSYLTNVEDRQICKPGSLRARYFSLLDKFACNLADRVLLDTAAQIEYFVTRYHLPAQKFIHVPVGVDNSIFHPILSAETRPIGDIKVHWHGHIVPFPGLQTIIEAAALLKDQPRIRFHIVTRFNERYKKIAEQAREMGLVSVEFHPETTYPRLAEMINDADICLGVFGTNLKAQLVIPNKIYEAVACKTVVVTSDTQAIR